MNELRFFSSNSSKEIKMIKQKFQVNNFFFPFFSDQIRFFCNPSIICLQTFKGILIPEDCRYLIQEQIISEGSFIPSSAINKQLAQLFKESNC